jgi:hypothetical protein
MPSPRHQCCSIGFVIGIHGRHAADLFVLGSTTQHVVRQAACPVLTIRQGEAPK